MNQVHHKYKQSLLQDIETEQKFVITVETRKLHYLDCHHGTRSQRYILGGAVDVIYDIKLRGKHDIDGLVTSTIGQGDHLKVL